MKATLYKMDWTTGEYNKHSSTRTGALSRAMALSKAKNQFPDLEVGDRIALQNGKSGVYEIELSEDLLITSGKSGQKLVEEMQG